MKVRVLRPALEDLAAGRQFYDRQQEGIGAYFFDSLFAEIDSLVLYAGIQRLQFGYHRLLARRFPYAVYYRVVGGEAVVHRVLDFRRDPKWIRRALQDSGSPPSPPNRRGPEPFGRRIRCRCPAQFTRRSVTSSFGDCIAKHELDRMTAKRMVRA